MIDAKIILDSVAPSKVRLTTFVLKYPRFIHSELMTHRVFSRNASSSRAIPVKKQIDEVMSNPAIPIEFRKNQKGMQAGELIEDQTLARRLWLEARDAAALSASKMAGLGIHKQYANRIIEPYSHISVVLTSTEFSNWFALRYHGDAQPEIRELAKSMWEAYKNSIPYGLEAGEWHLPFVNDEDRHEWCNSDLLIRSVARCARVSYNKHDGAESTLEEDTVLHDRLLTSKPMHASPAEHQAMAVGDPNVRSGNFRGWIQYRKTLPDENVTVFYGP